MANETVLQRAVAGLDHGRKLRNLLLQPRLQLKLPLYLLLLTAAFALLLWIVLHQGFQGVYELILLQSGVDEEIRNIVKYQSGALVIVVTTMLIVYVLGTIGITVGYMHKLVGPTKAFQRHISELKNGVYSSRLTMRKNDAFSEVAQELNELAEILEHKHQRGQSKAA